MPSNTHHNSAQLSPLRRTVRDFSLAPLLGSVLQLGGDEEVPEAVGGRGPVKNPLVGGKPFGETASHRTVNTARGCVQLFLG